MITGVILAGGRGRQLDGTDKGLLELNGRPLIVQVAEILAPQVATLLINANRNLERYRALGWAVVSDATPDFRGPLAGIAAGFTHCATEWLLAVPCDMPYLPENLAQRLLMAARFQGVRVAVPWDGDKIHWVCVLIHRDLASDLIAHLSGDDLSLRGWIAQYPFARSDFSDQPARFVNLNTWTDLWSRESISLACKI